MPQVLYLWHDLGMVTYAQANVVVCQVIKTLHWGMLTLYTSLVRRPLFKCAEGKGSGTANCTMWHYQSDRFIVNNHTSQTTQHEINVNACNQRGTSSARANNLHNEMYIALMLQMSYMYVRIPQVQLAVHDVTRPFFHPHVWVGVKHETNPTPWMVCHS